MSAYFNTTHLTGSDLHDAHKAAQTQDAVILALYRTHNRPLSPSEVLALCEREGRKWPLTSIRRSITNLAKANALTKLDEYHRGPYGHREGYWVAFERQGRLVA